MLKKMLHKLVLKEKVDSDSYISFLRKKGVSIGSDVTFYSPSHTMVDVTAPWLISIGNHVQITHGVIILSHDYSWAVLKRYSKSKGIVLGAQAPVKIGDNVFIGMNSIITRGVTVGDNVIIGAGSIVTRDCEANSVYAGNPARKIMTLDEYLQKRIKSQLTEAKTLSEVYQEVFCESPSPEVFREYCMLFSDAESCAKSDVFSEVLKLCENYEDSIEYLKNNKPMFSSYDEFLKSCYNVEVDDCD